MTIILIKREMTRRIRSTVTKIIPNSSSDRGALVKLKVIGIKALSLSVRKQKSGSFFEFKRLNHI